MRSEVLVERMAGGRRSPTPSEDMVGSGWLYHVHDLSLKTLRDREHAVRSTLPHGRWRAVMVVITMVPPAAI